MQKVSHTHWDTHTPGTSDVSDQGYCLLCRMGRHMTCVLTCYMSRFPNVADRASNLKSSWCVVNGPAECACQPMWRLYVYRCDWCNCTLFQHILRLHRACVGNNRNNLRSPRMFGIVFLAICAACSLLCPSNTATRQQLTCSSPPCFGLKSGRTR